MLNPLKNKNGLGSPFMVVHVKRKNFFKWILRLLTYVKSVISLKLQAFRLPCKKPRGLL